MTNKWEEASPTWLSEPKSWLAGSYGIFALKPTHFVWTALRHKHGTPPTLPDLQSLFRLYKHLALEPLLTLLCTPADLVRQSMDKAFLGIAIIIANVSSWKKFIYALAVFVHHALMQCQYPGYGKCARVREILDPANSCKLLHWITVSQWHVQPGCTDTNGGSSGRRGCVQGGIIPHSPALIGAHWAPQPWETLYFSLRG